MEANELRIGNLVYDEQNRRYEIESIITDRIKNTIQLNLIDESGCGIENAVNVTPIPLTEEWLVKFGFFEINEYQDHYRWAKEMNDKFGVLCEWEKNIFTYGWIKNPTKIKYVHQLQNLYFSLTGKELTIK